MAETPKDMPRIIGSDDAIQIEGDRVVIEGHVHHLLGVTKEEIQFAAAEHYGVTPDDIQVSHSRQSTGKSFGFSNWNGSKWVPKGPKGNYQQNPEQN